jgi:hypothetical protein
MATRLELHSELLGFMPNVYFQPPSSIQMVYPCIVYNKTGRMRHFANDVIYSSQQEYTLTLIEKDPDSSVADNIEVHFQHCAINQYFTVDNLNHTKLSLYY